MRELKVFNKELNMDKKEKRNWAIFFTIWIYWGAKILFEDLQEGGNAYGMAMIFTVMIIAIFCLWDALNGIFDDNQNF